MSFDIDMQDYGRSNAPAATEQPVVDTNSYQQEAQDYSNPLDMPVSNEAESIPQKENTNPQAENFRALREEVDRIKVERENEKRDHQLQLDILRANLSQQQMQRPQEPTSKRMFDGMKDEDVPNVSELRREWEMKEADYQSRLEELHVQQMHPDYAEVIEKFALPLVKQKPHLAEGLRGATNKALFAYELGKMAQSMTVQQVATTKSENAQRIIDNSKKPGTLSQAGGQGALSKADYFATMSDQEFMRYAGKNLDGI